MPFPKESNLETLVYLFITNDSFLAPLYINYLFVCGGVDVKSLESSVLKKSLLLNKEELFAVIFVDLYSEYLTLFTFFKSFFNMLDVNKRESSNLFKQ